MKERKRQDIEFEPVSFKSNKAHELKKEAIILKFDRERSTSPEGKEVQRPSYLQKEKPATMKNYLEDHVPTQKITPVKEQPARVVADKVPDKGIERI